MSNFPFCPVPFGLFWARRGRKSGQKGTKDKIDFKIVDVFKFRMCEFSEVYSCLLELSLVQEKKRKKKKKKKRKEKRKKRKKI